jgi:hypothetical protein
MSMTELVLLPPQPPRIADQGIDRMISRVWGAYCDGDIDWKTAAQWDEALRRMRILVRAQ